MGEIVPKEVAETAHIPKRLLGRTLKLVHDHSVAAHGGDEYSIAIVGQSHLCYHLPS